MFVMSIAELLKKNFVMIPVVISILVGTFTGVKYIVSLTETINQNKSAIKVINETDLKNHPKTFKTTWDREKINY